LPNCFSIPQFRTSAILQLQEAMPDKKEPEFTVTDRRRFTSEGETTPEIAPEPQPEARPAEPPQAAAPVAPPPEPPKQEERNVPPPPSAADRQAQHDAFKETSKQLDAQIQSELGGRRVQDFEMNFERFIASLYMSALMQLGLMHEQGGQAGVDLLGARQTIDTLGMLADKTKGNLTMMEDNLMQNVLYELRMAYVEVTNAIARGPQTPGAPPPGGLNIK
jgi:type IV secretory pathway VirB10-like protein